MLARASTFALAGLEPSPVEAEVDVRPGLPAFTLVGLGDAAVRESRERVRAAIQNSGFEFPLKRIVANLAPADLRKEGPAFDAAIAAALLAASGQLPVEALAGVAVWGELSLGGEMRGTRGTLAAAECARAVGVSLFLAADESAQEAALVPELKVGAIRDLAELASVLSGGAPTRTVSPGPVTCGIGHGPELADVHGQPGAVRAAQIAAAGGHNLLMEGPPGVGKTMLARRIPGLLPPLEGDEALEVTRIQSAVGLQPPGGLVRERPFRAPHHTTSPVGLVGGGSRPMPGEVTLAHGGVLFLDELSEFPRNSLEALRQPLEDGSVTVVRRGGTATFPARFCLIGATNPCPCGMAGGGPCSCDQLALDRHRRRLSGPLLDRFDLLVGLVRPAERELESRSGTTTVEAAASVAAARELQAARWAGRGFRLNAEAPAADLTARCRIESEAMAVLGESYRRGMLGPRARVRAMRVARTIADISGSAAVTEAHMLEALALRLRRGKQS